MRELTKPKGRVSLTAEQVWKKMRDECDNLMGGIVCMHEDESSRCVFATCPLLHEAKEEK